MPSQEQIEKKSRFLKLFKQWHLNYTLQKASNNFFFKVSDQQVIKAKKILFLFKKKKSFKGSGVGLTPIQTFWGTFPLEFFSKQKENGGWLKFKTFDGI